MPPHTGDAEGRDRGKWKSQLYFAPCYALATHLSLPHERVVVASSCPLYRGKGTLWLRGECTCSKSHSREADSASGASASTITREGRVGLGGAPGSWEGKPEIHA